MSELTETPVQPVSLSDKEVRRLSRGELLEMLIRETRRCEQLEARLAEAQQQLQDRTLRVEQAGDLAHASLELNGVFEAAQAACQQYTENIRRLSDEQQQRSDRLLAETQAHCDGMLREAAAQRDHMLADVETQVRQQWDQIYQRLEQYRAAHAEVQTLLERPLGRTAAPQQPSSDQPLADPI